MIRRQPTTIKLSDEDIKEWKAEKQRILDQKKKESEKTMTKEQINMANKKKMLENKLVNRRKRIGIMSE